MGNQLRTFVHVADEHGEMHAFGPDDKLPRWARSAITNPKAWADSEDSTEETDPGTGEESGASGEQSPKEQDPGTSGESSGGEGDLVEPPRSGKGSGVEAWREYAEKLGWFEEVPAEATKDDLVKAIDAERAEREKKTGE